MARLKGNLAAFQSAHEASVGLGHGVKVFGEISICMAFRSDLNQELDIRNVQDLKSFLLL